MNNLDPLLQSELAKVLRARRHSTYFKILLVFLFVGVYATLLFFPTAIYEGLTASADDDGDKRFIPLVRIEGMIAPGESASAQMLQKKLVSAFEYEADGVILLINSPGGTPTQSIMIHDEILRLKKKHNKKVVVVAEDTLASGAYLISMSADEIYANQASTVGSVGVIMRGFGFVDLAEKLGVERRVYTAGESKSRFDPMVPATESDRKKAHELLTEVHDQFKEIVLAGRGSKIDPSNAALFSGDFWTGREAEKLGLIDGLLSVSSVVSEVFGADGTKEQKDVFGISDLMKAFKDAMGLSVLTDGHLKPGIWLLPSSMF